MQSAPLLNLKNRPAIDPEHLARVTFGDSAFRDEILGLFLRESKALLHRLATAKDDQEWRVAAHTLKGMSRGIGAVALGEAASEIELLANGVRLERRGLELARIGALAEEAAAEARSLIG